MHVVAAEPGRARLRIADATAMGPSGPASFGHISHFIAFRGVTFSSARDPQERAAITDSITSMLRYLALATALVLGIAIVVSGWGLRDRLRINVGEGRGQGGAPNPQASTTPPPSSTLAGDAPWVLSALPDCFEQLAVDTGPRAFLLHHLPAGSIRIAPPARLHYADCTISVVRDEVYVRRGRDAFRIPPPAYLYRSPGRLSLLRTTAVGGELRVYQPH
jgi:hypothetical protein